MRLTEAARRRTGILIPTPGRGSPVPKELEALLPQGLVPRSDIDFDTLAKHLKPLGNPKRLKLLHLLTAPQYLEEIASRLKMSRQGVRKHLDELVELGVVRKQLARRDFGPVTEYVLNHARLFHLSTEFGKLGSLKPARSQEDAAATLEHATTAGGPRVSVAGEPALLMVRGLNEGQVFALADQPGRAWRIGRGKEADIRLDYDPFLSNRHAEVRREQRGFVLVDAFSRNGTYVNWQKLEKGVPVPLQRGDVVGIGKTLLVFQVRTEGR